MVGFGEVSLGPRVRPARLAALRADNTRVSRKTILGERVQLAPQFLSTKAYFNHQE